MCLLIRKHIDLEFGLLLMSNNQKKPRKPFRKKNRRKLAHLSLLNQDKVEMSHLFYMTLFCQTVSEPKPRLNR